LGVVVAMLLGLRNVPLVAQSAQGPGAGPQPSKMMAADAHPEFEVATIKPSDPEDESDGFSTNGRHVSVRNQSVSKILAAAYGIHVRQVVDGPSWLGNDRYDISGVADVEGEPSLKQMQEMLQKLLADRFRLNVHREKRQLSVYAVTVLKTGPKLTKSKGDPNGSPDQEGSEHGTQTASKFTNTSMADFAFIMQFFLDRPMVDQTGLTGRYDFSLRWTFDETQASSDPNAVPGIFTAIQEQIGLKLEAVKAQADVIVIDHVERPSAN
jgi:uncharacterized protein (TIGR03435 family)